MCTCIDDYEGNIVWNATANAYTGECLAMCLESLTVPYTVGADTANIFLPMMLSSGAEMSFSCQSWHSGYRGSVILECDRGAVAVRTTANASKASRVRTASTQTSAF